MLLTVTGFLFNYKVCTKFNLVLQYVRHCKDLETVLACMLRVRFLLIKMPYSVIT